MIFKLAAIGLLACSLFGQSELSVSRFEVASIKAIPSPVNAIPSKYSMTPHRAGGRITWTTDVVDLVRYAYEVPVWRIRGADKYQAFYLIDATVDVSASEEFG